MLNKCFNWLNYNNIYLRIVSITGGNRKAKDSVYLVLMLKGAEVDIKDLLSIEYNTWFLVAIPLMSIYCLIYNIFPHSIAKTFKLRYLIGRNIVHVAFWGRGEVIEN